jgi:hypothetical protein
MTDESRPRPKCPRCGDARKIPVARPHVPVGGRVTVPSIRLELCPSCVPRPGEWVERDVLPQMMRPREG